jgi:predicted patatin/cPLA2 family phospholipase
MFVSNELRNNKKFILEVIKKYTQKYENSILQFVNEDLQNDKDIVFAAVIQNGVALRFASKELRNNKEVVLAAVKNEGWALTYVSDELRNDEDVVVAAVTRHGYMLEHVSEELKNDEYFLYKVDCTSKIIHHSCIFKFLSERIQEEIIKDADYLSKFETVYLKPAKR